jgi:hypothetical protein
MPLRELITPTEIVGLSSAVLMGSGNVSLALSGSNYLLIGVALDGNYLPTTIVSQVLNTSNNTATNLLQITQPLSYHYINGITGAEFASGKMIVAWNESFSISITSESAIANYVILDGTGTSIEGLFSLNTVPGTYNRNISVTQLSTGNVIVVWEQVNPVTKVAQILSQHVDATGTMLGTAVALTGPIDLALNVTLSNWAPSVAALAHGSYAVAWQHYGMNGSSITAEIHARIFGEDGSPYANEFNVSGPLRTIANAPSIMPISTGGFAVIWKEQYTIRSRAQFSMRMEAFQALSSKSKKMWE